MLLYLPAPPAQGSGPLRSRGTWQHGAGSCQEHCHSIAKWAVIRGGLSVMNWQLLLQAIINQKGAMS